MKRSELEPIFGVNTLPTFAVAARNTDWGKKAKERKVAVVVA